MGYHSPLSPSGAPKYLRCYGSVEAEKGLPDETSVFAAEGTVLHDVAAMVLQFGLNPDDFVGCKMESDGFEFEIEQDHADCMKDNIAWVQENLDPKQLYIERRVKLDWPLKPGESGTSDIIGMLKDRPVVVCADWKFGAGEPVDAVENEQAKLYCIGAIQEYFPDLPDDTEVWIVIMQPRVVGGNRQIWKTTKKALWSWGDEIHPIVQTLGTPGLPRTPGKKQCRWCKAKKASNGGCYAYDEWVQSTWMAEFTDLTEATMTGSPPIPKNPAAMSDAERSWALAHSDLIKDWLKDLHEWAFKKLQRGEELPDFELDKGRKPARKWKDEDKAKTVLIDKLKDKAYQEPKLLSPTQVNDLVGDEKYKTDFASYVDEGEAKSILVPKGTAKEVVKTTKDLFESLD